VLRYLCVGCQLNSDQALRSLCVKGHVKARGSTLWPHRWQTVTEFLCTKTPLLEGVEQPKKWPKPPGNAFSDTLLMSSFQNSKARFVRFFETTLRAVLINESIRINLRPKILRICFLLWSGPPSKLLWSFRLIVCWELRGDGPVQQGKFVSSIRKDLYCALRFATVARLALCAPPQSFFDEHQLWDAILSCLQRQERSRSGQLAPACPWKPLTTP